MPKDLAALLVEEKAAPADAVARALERQRAAGGSLDTALLEQKVLPEDVLLGYLARAAELPVAPESAWAAADARARRVFPSRVAERHGLAPFALDGRELALVATYPVDLSLLDEISFMLSLHLTAHVGTEWRVRELIHRLYESPFPPRLASLAAAAGAAVEAPPAGAEGAAAPPAGGAGAPPQLGGFSRDASEPLEPLAAALQQALDDPSLFADEPAGEGEAEGEGEGEEPGAEADAAPPDRSAPPRWKPEDARAALAAARHRDEVVLAALRYARDFFEYAAVFAVTRDAIAGHDALGAEDERDRARSVAIWASDPGIFKTVVETRSPYLGPVPREAAGNEAVLSGLGRGKPRTVLVHPVLLRDRPVCVVYADNGEAPVSARRLGDLLLFLSTVGAAFERIIRDRKKRGRRRRAAAPAASEAEPPAGVPGEASSPAEPGSGAGPAPAPPAPPPPASPRDGELPPFEFGAPEEPAASPAAAGSAMETALASVDVDVDSGGPPAEVAPPEIEPSPPAPPRRPAALDDLEERFFTGSPAAAPRASPREPPRARATQAAVAPPEPARSAPAQRPAPPQPPASGARRPTPAPAPRSPEAPGAPEPPSLATLADRALDPDPVTSTGACEALAEHRRDPGIRPANEKLRRALLSGISSRATRAARAIGAIRDVEAIPLLIQVLETSEPETANAAADALAAITLQRLGPDARKWLNWWKENRGRGRAEWLFSGLTNPDRETRVAASVELALAAPPPVAYSADLPPAERERIARAWAGWWARSGHVL